MLENLQYLFRDQLSEDDLKKIVYEFEHLEEKEAEVAEYIFGKLKPSYQALLQVSYM